MTQPPVLRVDWCTHAAAVFACKRWHYSHSVPVPPLVKIGVWENDAYIGCVLFSRGACAQLGQQYGLTALETCELTRVALTDHHTPVTRIVAIAIKFLRRHCPGTRLIVSFADPAQGHHGGIYQGGNWLYTGQSNDTLSYIDAKGRKWHSRQVSRDGRRKQFGQVRPAPKLENLTLQRGPGKHRYLLPLDEALRKQLLPLVLPFPKRLTAGAESAPEAAK